MYMILVKLIFHPSFPKSRKQASNQLPILHILRSSGSIVLKMSIIRKTFKIVNKKNVLFGYFSTENKQFRV
eukprot:maker-scaffold_7-snap-gene-8.56-mRNA-1 protein AED:0.45 eAED:0.49 QI:0/0/0/1/0/0/3/0/70